MQGRWTIRREWDDSRVIAVGPVVGRDEAVPVVPCDDAAIERAVAAMCSAHGADCPDAEHSRRTVELVLRAAGETP